MISIVKKSHGLLELRLDNAVCYVAQGDYPSRAAQSEAVGAIIREYSGGTVEVRHDADGAPRLPEGYPQISISHCRLAVAVAFSPCPVGVDVETWRDQLLRVAPRFLTGPEREAVGDNAVGLLRAWTFKEAAFKMLHAEGQAPPTVPQIPLWYSGCRSLTLHLPDITLSVVIPSGN